MQLFKNDYTAIFIKRPNRFIIHGELDGKVVICHCPNTGRMEELLFPGVKLILEKSGNPDRKTKYTVVAVFRENLVVPITSARANDVAGDLIIPKLFNNPVIKREITFNKSRFDFYVTDGDEKFYIEVKSCTLFIGDNAVFPDAPTTRGVKHLNELEKAVELGFKGMVILVVFNPCSRTFTPNHITDPLFSETMKKLESRIKIIPYKVNVDETGYVSIPKGNPVLKVCYDRPDIQQALQ